MYQTTLKSSISIAALASLFLGSTAMAADIYGGATQGDPTSAAYVAPVKVNFTGLYVGGAIGYGNANHDLSVRDYFKDFCADADDASSVDFNPFDDEHGWPKHLIRKHTLANKNEGTVAGDVGFRVSCEEKVSKKATTDPVVAPAELVSTGDVTIGGDSRGVKNLDGLNSTGVVGDLRLGYDQQMGRFVLGIFGTYGFSGMEADGATLGGAFTNFDLERGDDWSIGARAGVLVNDRTLLYILAAYTETEYDFSGTFNGEAFSQDTTFSGITVGGGVEFALTQNIFLGVEGTHTFYDGETIFDHYDPATNVGTLIHDDLGETRLLGTLKIKLNDIFN